MTSLFGFFVALAISVKQKDSSAVKIKGAFLWENPKTDL